MKDEQDKALDNLMAWQQEFEKQKPVAWMELYYGEPNNLAWTNAELKNSGDIYKTVPLYTTPRELVDEIEALKHDNEELLKSLTAERTPIELSDEEIANLWLEYGYGQPLSNSTFDFARAILKKASEK